jgi:hypothetical protein
VHIHHGNKTEPVLPSLESHHQSPYIISARASQIQTSPKLINSITTHTHHHHEALPPLPPTTTITITSKSTIQFQTKSKHHFISN